MFINLNMKQLYYFTVFLDRFVILLFFLLQHFQLISVCRVEIKIKKLKNS